MFRKRTIAVLVFTLVIIVLPFSMSAQQNDEDGNSNKAKAMKSFEEGDYGNAYNYFNSLLSRYPKDGLLNYYTGLSLFYQNKQIEKAIEHLENAAGKPRVPDDVFYFLGQAYRKVYMFPESKKAFSTYNTLASRAEQKEMIPAREAEMSGNAMSSTLKYNPFEILATSLFSFEDSTIISQVRGKGGILNKKPEELKGKEDSSDGLSDFVFLPKNIQKGDYVYFSAYGKSKKKGLDLYRVRKITAKKWGIPEAISELNTEFDEIMPYYDPVSKDLYFASKGYESMGGFDVFKSHYDSERDSWSEPVSLGFPVNSPMNEYLAMPGYDLGTILIITDRQGLNQALTVYKLKLSEPKRSLSSVDTEELKRIGNLGGISSIPEIVDLKKEELITEADINNVSADKKIKTQTPKLPIDPNRINIKEALYYQQKSDSLSRLARASRVKVSTLNDPDDRWAYQSLIIEWEKLSRDYQEKADIAYANLEEQKQEQQSAIPAEITEKKVVRDIRVYEYTDPVAKQETGKMTSANDLSQDAIRESFKTENEPGEVVMTKELNKNPINRFAVLSNSPYNPNNPFPTDVKLPDGAFYRIQMGVFSKQVDYSNFGGISPITAEGVDGKNLTRYFAGKFGQFSDAQQALEKVKQEGFLDAFIVGWYNGEKMALNRVQEFEFRDAR